MNVDFGLVATFAIQVALVAAVYHAWRGIKAEISALAPFKDQYNTLVTVTSALQTQITDLGKRMDEVKAMPKATMERITELEAGAEKTSKALGKLWDNVLSVGGRISALQRWAKTAEKDPAAEAEDLEGATPPGSPGSSSSQETSGLPPSFGLVAKGRRVSNG